MYHRAIQTEGELRRLFALVGPELLAAPLAVGGSLPGQAIKPVQVAGTGRVGIEIRFRVKILDDSLQDL